MLPKFTIRKLNLSVWNLILYPSARIEWNISCWREGEVRCCLGFRIEDTNQQFLNLSFLCFVDEMRVFIIPYINSEKVYDIFHLFVILLLGKQTLFMTFTFSQYLVWESYYHWHHFFLRLPTILVCEYRVLWVGYVYNYFN